MATTRRLSRPQRPAPPAQPIELAVTSLGAGGDGIALREGRRLFIPFTVPGDRVVARPIGPDRAEVLEWRARGPGRVDPPCPHFGACGGCALQHLDDASYAAWKADLLPAALRQRSLAATEVRPLIRTPPGRRRRAELAAIRRGAEIRVGFHARRDRVIEPIQSCLVLLPALVALVPTLRAFLPRILRDGEAADLWATVTPTGIDLMVTRRRPLDLADREALASFAGAADLARVAWHAEPDSASETIAERRRPRIALAGGESPIDVEPPPGAFLQASEDGEREILRAVLSAVEDARRIADLYAGCGTLTLPLAAAGPARLLRAIEGDEGMAAALAEAVRRAGLGGRVSVATRDLARRPLLPEELAGLDAVVFDPPFAGARAQAEQIARSKVPRAVGVSCNPATFARDARLLVDGGYRLAWVQPIDQFPWSPHLEVVGLFRR